MDWSVDLVWRSGGGTRFDSRGAQVTFLGHVGKAFSWIFTHMLACRVTLWRHFLIGSGSLFRDFWEALGSVWEWSGDIFRHMLEGFEKMSDGVRKLTFPESDGSIFPELGRFRIAFLTYPRSKHIKETKNHVLL